VADDVTLDERERRFGAALDKLKRTVEARGGVPNETLDEFLKAVETDRCDKRYESLLGTAGSNSD